MKTLSLFTAVLGLALFANAANAAPAPTATTPPAPKPAAASSTLGALPLGVNAVGYDVHTTHVTARIGLSQNNAVDVGFGVGYNTPLAPDDLQLGFSGFYLLKLQDWGMVDNYLTAGAIATVTDELGLKLFGGLQPEITLLERVIVSVRFGLEATVAPEFGMQTQGDAISIVEGLNFKIIW